MNPFDELEQIAKGELIPGGRASGKPKPQDDHESKKTGREIEMEHVEGGPLPKKVKEAVADEIHDDHVEEHPGYYDDKIGLPAMEERLKKLGKGEGSFRGGDPELAQMKQQESKEAQEDAGDVGDEGGEEEEPDEGAIQDEQDKQEAKQDKMASLGKAGPTPSISMGSQEVSPVNTDEDYFDDKDPKRDVGNYYLQFRGRSQPFVEPSPLDRRDHQHEVWSEALGYRIPLEGNPVFYLRRMALAGDKEGYKQGLKEVFKAVGEEPQTQGDEEPSPRMLLEHLTDLNQEQLIQIAKKIWGDDYEYEDWMDENYIREDVRGSLMDLMESEGAGHLEKIKSQMSADLEW